ncbi:hypothetical protein [Bacillus sp. S/N-304-OC-R1]|uniref:hypothetical protein n=1 Tax=Bacillus sp. S/N-304-OC-R1 TaxID=2758034 RepID=UPI001C8EC52D|nr:hypothetical protein [Bacillus sp. S/N-304-OC-R1]MBY0122796.1 hypothetical protein [Bacillus sp. S/N-304-OC-R1]
MNERWNKRKEKRKIKQSSNSYTFGDFIFDVLFWIPELIILPFRLSLWLLRGLGRFILDLF